MFESDSGVTFVVALEPDCAEGDCNQETESKHIRHRTSGGYFFDLVTGETKVLVDVDSLTGFL